MADLAADLGFGLGGPGGIARSFAQLSLAVQQLGAWEGSADITPTVLLQGINYALIEAFDVMVQKWADYYTIQLDYALLSGHDTYPLDQIIAAGPEGTPDFYKLRHLDWSSDGVRWHRMYPYDLDTQHLYSDRPSTSTRARRRYRLQGQNLIVAPTPSTAITIRLYYIPLPPQFTGVDDTTTLVRFDVPAEERLVVSTAYRDLLIRSDLSTVQAEQMIELATAGLRTAADGRDSEPFYLDPRGPRDHVRDGWGWGED